jgi:hypothetical protein
VRPTDRPNGIAGSQPPPVGPDTADGPVPEPLTSPASVDGERPDTAIGRATAAPAETEIAAADEAVARTSAGEGTSASAAPAAAGRDRATTPVRSALAPLESGWQRLRRRGGTASRSGAGSGARAANDGRVRSADVAVSTLARLSVLPAVLVVAWLVPGLPLLLGGSFLPVPMLLISVPLAAALTVNGLRDVPARWPRPGSAERAASGWTAWFGLLGTVAVVAGLAGWQLRESTESLIVLRDAGTYLQAGYWIAQHGALPISEQLRAFGGAHQGLTFASTGFLAHGTSLFPAVTSGLPMLLAAGAWVHGATGATAVGPIMGGLAALSFAGLAARLVGPAWAPAGALILGLSLPQQYVSRSSLSETVLQVVLFGGLCLLADSLVTRSAPDAAGRPARSPPGRAGRVRRLLGPAEWSAWLTPQRMLAGLAGLALGFGLLVSLDGALYLLPVIPFGALLVVGRRPQATPFLIGFIVGTLYGAAGAFILDRPFVDSVGATVALAGLVAVWLLVVSVVIGSLTRLEPVRRFVPRLLARVPLRWLPEFGALIAAGALIGFAVRPYVQKVRGHPSTAVAHFIGALQRLQGLPVDPNRLYSEQTLYWVIWYIGLPTVLLGGFGIALLVRHSLRALLTWRDPDGSWRIWALPLAIICAGSLVVLWQPDIIPDQPWASRRLVVIVLPGLIICGLWAASWLAKWARSRGARPATAAVVGVFCSAAMLVPTVSTTFGLGISHGGKTGGLKPVAQGLALQQTGAGQIEAVATLCAQIPRRASVVIVDRATAERFSQAIRGMCGVPVATMAGQPATAVSGVLVAISAAGRRPVLLASSARRLAGFGGSAVRILDLMTTGDPHELTQLPTVPSPDRYAIWMTQPSVSGFGA